MEKEKFSCLFKSSRLNSLIDAPRREDQGDHRGSRHEIQRPSESRKISRSEVLGGLSETRRARLVAE